MLIATFFISSSLDSFLLSLKRWLISCRELSRAKMSSRKTRCRVRCSFLNELRIFTIKQSFVFIFKKLQMNYAIIKYLFDLPDVECLLTFLYYFLPLLSKIQQTSQSKRANVLRLSMSRIYLIIINTKFGKFTEFFYYVKILKINTFYKKKSISI